MGGEIERDRQALLSGGEVAAVERVGIFRRGEAGILPDRPGLVDIHGRVGAAQIRRDARPGFEEIDALQIGFAVAGFDQDAFGREPGFGVAAPGRRDSRTRHPRSSECGSCRFRTCRVDHTSASSAYGMCATLATTSTISQTVDVPDSSGVHASVMSRAQRSAHKFHTCSVMVRMLVADDFAELFRAVILQRGLARQIGDGRPPSRAATRFHIAGSAPAGRAGRTRRS